MEGALFFSDHPPSIAADRAREALIQRVSVKNHLIYETIHSEINIQQG